MSARPKASKASGTKVHETKVKDALDHFRASTQELHAAISDAAAKRGGAMRADLEVAAAKARAVAESIRGSMAGQDEAARKHLAAAIESLAAVQQDAHEGMKNAGREFEAAVRQIVAGARDSARQVSEAVAAKRSAESSATRKK
ncbi:MAG TPA: hypothetical protein VLV56_17150 [Burkholderiales bacterium]|nr:hypothetical protein [Burkholderiales bacterium]HUP09024.1 hypothetical protein [Caldimonas sp.]